MIKVQKIGRLNGFTKEQLAEVAEVLINELNLIEGFAEVEKLLFEGYEGNIKKFLGKNYWNIELKKVVNAPLIINIKGTKCKFTIEHNIYNLLNMLLKFHISIEYKEEKSVNYDYLINNGVISLDEYVKEIAVKEHKNAVTGHVYSGNNAELLNHVINKKGYKSFEWVGKYQARKIGKQAKQYADGAVIKIYYTDDDGRSFCKLETVYNVEELEPIVKVENTSSYKDMIKRLKAV